VEYDENQESVLEFMTCAEVGFYDIGVAEAQ